MRIALLILGALALAYVICSGVNFYRKVQISKKLIDSTVPFEKTGSAAVAVLVLGDSTAVGIGADAPADSVAGRVSGYLEATSVENYAKSGAVTRDLPAQIGSAKLERYRLILIQIGGNDIIRFRSAENAAEDLARAVALLPDADEVVIISAGDVGGATLFPSVVRPFHTRLNDKYHEAFATTAAELGVTYVNFGDSPATRLITERPDIYLARDGLHPSSEGYRLWFEDIRESL